MQITTNYHVQLPKGDRLEWAIIEDNNEILEILGDGELAARMPLLSRKFNLIAWFRQLAIERTDQWIHICHVKVGFREEVQPKMGCGAALSSIHRLIILLVHVITNQAIKEG